MMNKDEFQDYVKRNSIKESGVAFLSVARTEIPARTVSSTYFSGKSLIPSPKMGHLIMSESKTLAARCVRELEFKPRVVEFFDEPNPKIELVHKNSKGRKSRVMYTLDYLALNIDGVDMIECKREDALRKMATRWPERFHQDSNGLWRWPQMEQIAQEMGFSFRFYTDAHINWIFQDNYDFLLDYRLPSCQLPEERIILEISQLVKKCPGILLKDLFQELGGAGRVDDVHTLIAKKLIFVDINKHKVRLPDKCPVFISDEVANAIKSLSELERERLPVDSLELEIGGQLEWSGVGHIILNVGYEDVTLEDTSGNPKVVKRSTIYELFHLGAISGLSRTPPSNSKEREAAIYLKTSPEDIKKAAEKSQVVLKWKKGASVSDLAVNDRTLRGWCLKFDQAEIEFGNGLIGLIPKNAEKGNRTPRISEDHKEMIRESLEGSLENSTGGYSNPKQLTVAVVYGDYLLAALKQGLTPISEKSYAEYIRSLDTWSAMRGRFGLKYANQHLGSSQQPKSPLPIHGEFPFHRLHLDNTPTNTGFVDPNTGEYLGTGRKHMAIDENSSMILACYVSFDHPNYLANMILIRMIVKRFHRLGNITAIDGGKEYDNKYMLFMGGQFGFTVESRRKGFPEDGNLIESILGLSHKELDDVLCGNNKPYEDRNNMTKETNPSETSAWTISAYSKRFTKWCFTDHNLERNDRLGMSPQQFFQQGLASAGARTHREILYDDNFLFCTMPPPKSKSDSRTVSKKGRIKVDNTTYKSPELSKYVGQLVKVRIDPFNPSRIVAYLKYNTKDREHEAMKGGRWVECRGNPDVVTDDYTEAELLELAISRSKSKQQTSNKRKGRAVSKADARQELMEIEAMLKKERAKNLENQAILKEMGIIPVTTQSSTASGTTSQPREDMETHLDSSNSGNNNQELETYEDF